MKRDKPLNSRAWSARLMLLIAALSFLLPFSPRSALAAESVTYLFPAPPLLPAFGPLQIA
jgi:hypothetical protein